MWEYTFFSSLIVSISNKSTYFVCPLQMMNEQTKGVHSSSLVEQIDFAYPLAEPPGITPTGVKLLNS
jgi:hypothetical protein